MRSHSVAAGVLLTLGVAGCSSPSAPELPAGALPPGTATVGINAGDDSTDTAVACQPLGESLTRITIGSPASGIIMFIDYADGVIPKSLAINDVDGFTGSYWQGLQGSAKASMVGHTVKIDGSAMGFDTNKPSFVTTRDFRISVAC